MIFSWVDMTNDMVSNLYIRNLWIVMRKMHLSCRSLCAIISIGSIKLLSRLWARCSTTTSADSMFRSDVIRLRIVPSVRCDSSWQRRQHGTVTSAGIDGNFSGKKQRGGMWSRVSWGLFRGEYGHWWVSYWTGRETMSEMSQVDERFAVKNSSLFSSFL